MNAAEQTDLILLFHTLADEQRLALLRLMSQQPRTIREMAEELHMPDLTISQHVNTLHQVGLLNISMAGNEHLYRVNPRRLGTFKSHAAALDAPLDAEIEDDTRWIDALNIDEADKKVLRSHTFKRRLTHFPTKDKQWFVVLRWITSHFEPGVRYQEKQVNAVLTEIHADYATLRRSLIEFGLMQRERGGGPYWLTAQQET